MITWLRRVKEWQLEERHAWKVRNSKEPDNTDEQKKPNLVR